MTETPGRDPRFALACFYAAHFGHIGIVLPFLPPRFHALGLSAFQIGVLLAIPAVSKILSPFTWGKIVDRSGRRVEVLTGSLLLASIAFFSLALPREFRSILPVMVVYAVCLAPALPLTEATAMEQVGRHGFAYGRLRLWGSLAFIVAAAGFGLFRDSAPVWAGFGVGAVLLVLAASSGFRFPAPLAGGGQRPAAARSGGETAAGKRELPTGLVRLLAATTLMQMSHGPYYTFYSIHLEELGYGGTAIGSLWALGVLAEVLLLIRIDGVLDRVGAPVVLRISLVLAVLRWLLISRVTDPLWLAAGQVLHAFTYASFHVAALREVFARFGPGQRAFGQTLYSGLSFGLGMVLGNLLSGLLLDRIGLPSLFSLAAGLAGLGVLLAPKGLRAPVEDPA